MVGASDGERIGLQQLGIQLRAAYLALSVSPVVQPPQRVVDRPQLGIHFREQVSVRDGRRVVNVGSGVNAGMVSRRHTRIGHI